MKNRPAWMLSAEYSFLVLPVISGVLLIGAFPPFEQGYLAWVALLPLLGITVRVSPRRAFWAGLTFGIPLNLYLNLYLSRVLFPYLSTGLALTAMAALVLYISLFYGLFALLANLAARSEKPWFTALAIPSLWVLIEYLRSAGFLAYNVGYLGYSQWGYPVLLNITSVYGYWGLPFLMVLFQSILLLAFRKELQGKPLSVVAAIFFILLTAGILLPTAERTTGEEKRLIAALIQGNSNPGDIVQNSKDEIMQHYLNLSIQALEREPAVELVVWPETVVDLDLTENPGHHPEMAQVFGELNTSLLYGARVRDRNNLYNTISLLTHSSDHFPMYQKQRLVPFVEYFPLDGFLNRILDLDLLLGSYTAGEKAEVFHVGDITLAGAVCFESYFGSHTRSIASGRSDHLFILTNDAWFGDSIGLDLHAQAAAIRAAEIGIGVTQVANSGITISFDYQGREKFRTAKNEMAVMIQPIDMTGRNTLYARFGDYFPAFLGLFMIISITFPLVRRFT
jgi:apolipoprotein N-acyltransferase